MVDPSTRGIPLAQLTVLSAMMAGAVAGALTGWIARRNFLLTMCTFMIGIMGGMLTGTGMGRLFYVHCDGSEMAPIKAGIGALLQSGLAGLAGAIPSAFLTAVAIGFLTLRHLHPRPPRVRTVLTGVVAGLITGILTAMVIAVT
jgi:hypothetical protein